MATPKITENCSVICKMTPIGVRLNLKIFILISCAVTELLRKVSRGGRGAEPAPPGADRVKNSTTTQYDWTNKTEG